MSFACNQLAQSHAKCIEQTDRETKGDDVTADRATSLLLRLLLLLLVARAIKAVGMRIKRILFHWSSHCVFLVKHFALARKSHTREKEEEKMMPIEHTHTQLFVC